MTAKEFGIDNTPRKPVTGKEEELEMIFTRFADSARTHVAIYRRGEPLFFFGDQCVIMTSKEAFQEMYDHFLDVYQRKLDNLFPEGYIITSFIRVTPEPLKAKFVPYTDELNSTPTIPPIVYVGDYAIKLSAVEAIGKVIDYDNYYAFSVFTVSGNEIPILEEVVHLDINRSEAVRDVNRMRTDLLEQWINYNKER